MSSSENFPSFKVGDAFAPLLGAIHRPVPAPAPTVSTGGPFPQFDAPAAAAVLGTDEESEAETRARLHEAELQAAYERGVADGRANARTELVELASGFTRAVDEVVRFQVHLAERYEQELLALAVEVAGKILRAELEIDQEWWLGVIREAIHRAVDRERIRIRAGSELHQYLSQNLAKIRASLEEVRELELVEDPSLAATGVVIETAYGDLDASIESQLEAVRMGLTEPE
jgi:flagellar assembly protein FliH